MILEDELSSSVVGSASALSGCSCSNLFLIYIGGEGVIWVIRSIATKCVQLSIQKMKEYLQIDGK